MKHAKRIAAHTGRPCLVCKKRFIDNREHTKKYCSKRCKATAKQRSYRARNPDKRRKKAA